jgi:hypothetical protein
MSETEVFLDRPLPQASAAKRPRSAITSGKRLFIGRYDKNSQWVRRYHDLVGRHVADLGGRDLLSEAQLSLIRRAATLECELERCESLLAREEQVNLDEYGRATSTLRRLFETLGLRRVARDVTPDPLAYAREAAP